MISSSRLATDRSVGETATDGNEIDKLGREWLGECVAEMELLVPWLEVEALRDLAEDSSCESDTDCESDLTAVRLGIRLSTSQVHTSSGATRTRPRCGKKGACLTHSTAPDPLTAASSAGRERSHLFPAVSVAR